MTEYSIPNTGEGYRVRPFYICIDVSGSMGPDLKIDHPWPIDAVNDDLAALLENLHGKKAVSELIRMALISFAETANLEYPLSDPDKINALPKLQAGGKTSYAEPLKKLREAIEHDFYNRKSNKWYRPVVMFITDGYPNIETDEEWHSARDKLIDRHWKPHPIFVVFGFGNANEEIIKTLATGQKYTGVACMALKNETPTNQINRIISKLQQSILYSAENPSQFTLDPEGLLVLTPHEEDTVD